MVDFQTKIIGWISSGNLSKKEEKSINHSVKMQGCSPYQIVTHRMNLLIMFKKVLSKNIFLMEIPLKTEYADKIRKDVSAATCFSSIVPMKHADYP